MNIRIEGLRNVASTAHLEKKLEAVPGVQSVEIDVEHEQAMVEHEGADLRKIRRAVLDEGLHVTST